MKAADKDQVMQAFKEHKLDLLVATTVIEVGVDVSISSNGTSNDWNSTRWQFINY
jgi:RecG-like helicase